MGAEPKAEALPDCKEQLGYRPEAASSRGLDGRAWTGGDCKEQLSLAISQVVIFQTLDGSGETGLMRL